MSNIKKAAMVVFSGGLDSTTCLYWAREKFETVHAITFDYGQLNRIEIESAQKIAKMAGITTHTLLDVDGLLRSTSPLVNPSTPLAEYRSEEDLPTGGGVEKTFVPFRNQLFLTLAANRALALECRDIVTGVSQVDSGGYPDCTSAFCAALEDTMNVGTFGPAAPTREGRITIHAPLLHLSKAETAKLAFSIPGCFTALRYSHTAYDGKYPPTGRDHASILRAAGFREAGLPDPLVLRAKSEGLMELPDTPNYDGFR